MQIYLIQLLNLDCGPLKARIAEEDGCFMSNGTSKPCPTNSKVFEFMMRKCIPPYADGYIRKPLVEYKCLSSGWSPSYNLCHSGLYEIFCTNNIYFITINSTYILFLEKYQVRL